MNTIHSLSYWFSILFLSIIINSCQSQEAKQTDQEDEVNQLLTVSEFKEKLGQTNNAQLIDVRTPGEFSSGHLKDSELMNVLDSGFKDQVETLNKNEPLFVYCKVGGRSAKAANILKELGFEEVYDMQGGITYWNKAGYEVVK